MLGAEATAESIEGRETAAIAQDGPQTPSEPPSSEFDLVEPENLVAPSLEPVAALPPFPQPNAAIVGRVPLRAFRSRNELRRFGRPLLERSVRGRAGSGTGSMMSVGSLGSRTVAAPTVTANAAAAPAGTNENITNTQVAGIDEGDIVKALGDHFLVLRQGVLFSIAMNGTPAVVDRLHVQLPEQGDGWIDEMLVHVPSRRIVITGFVSGPDDREYTLYHLFELTDEGRIVRGDAIFFPSFDYYDGENYATRMVGNNLVAYTMHELGDGYELDSEDLEGFDPDEVARLREEAKWDHQLPQMRVGDGGRFQATWSPRRVFREQGRADRTMHAITSCPLDRTPVRCRTRGVMADGEAQLFVSDSAAYLWMNEMSYLIEPDENASEEAWNRFERESLAAPLYRFPHNRENVQSMPVVGRASGPLAMTEEDGELRVLVDGLSEFTEHWFLSDNEEIEDDLDAMSEVALLRVRLADFARTPTRANYTPMPGDAAPRVRFVGRHVLYFDGSDQIYVHDLETQVTRSVTGGGDRIDPLGANGALLSWSRNANLEFIALDLRQEPRAAEYRRIASVHASETRTHGFFFQPDMQGGTFGMPLALSWRGGERAMIGFFDLRDFRSTLVGKLLAVRDANVACANSCTDWYGNARPIFWRERVFALLGDELIEGGRTDGTIAETNRLLLEPPDPPEPAQ